MFFIYIHDDDLTTRITGVSYTEWGRGIADTIIIIKKRQPEADFTIRVIFSDEAHFHLLSYVNKHNCPI